MNQKKLFLTFALAAMACPAPMSAADIKVDVHTVLNPVTPYLYGSCIEDVNHEIYGGLYAQRIFGESFEEPLPTPRFRGFSSYEGSWDMRDGVLHATAFSGSKMVSDSMTPADGEVSVDLRFPDGGESAGLIVRASRAGNGADNFYGYEIGLSADGKRVIIGKHKNNFEHIRDVAVDCDPRGWNTLSAKMKGSRIDVYLNGRKVTSFTDRDADLAAGTAALRVWNADTEFRNFRAPGHRFAFEPMPVPSVSRHWDGFASDSTLVRFVHSGEGAFHGDMSQIVELRGDGVAGIANSGLNRWGIDVSRGECFAGRVYLKSPDYRGAVTVALQSADGRRTYASEKIENVGADWAAYPFELCSEAADSAARFAISIDRPGSVAVDMVTLMPTGDKLFHGLPMRRDIAEAMQGEGLTFLRYGGTMINAPEYRFKKMIGDRDRRPPYHGHWNRWSTNGFGIEDFVALCEKAGFTPAFAINIEESPEDVADMIEYLNGSTETEWGAMRAANGHPEPYGVRYIGIGNEEVLFHGDRADEYDHYVERFNLLYDAIKSKDPSVMLVNTAWWRPDSPNIEKVFRALDGRADYWDYHPWADALTSGKEVEAELRRMRDMFLGWNPGTKMKCAIFEENGVTHNVQRMLGHVTLQNAVRRMGDFVLTSCAANALQPWLQNDNGWDQGQIFFSPGKVWCQPPYYAQQMASRAHQPFLIASETDDPSGCLDVTATRSADGRTVVLHVANTGAAATDANIAVDGLGRVSHAGAVTLSGAPDDRNTPAQPHAVVPAQRELPLSAQQTVTLPPYSYTVITLSE